MALAFLLVNLVPAGFEIINVGTSSQLEALFRYFQREWLPTNKILLWNVHGVSMRINNHMEGWHNRMTKRARKHAPPGFLQLIIDEQGKTETVVQQMDDDYTREMGFVRRSARLRVDYYIFILTIVLYTNMYTYLKPYSKAARHVEEKYSSLIFLILKRANISEVRLVPNYDGSISRVYEGRAYKMKHASRQRKYWISSKINKQEERSMLSCQENEEHLKPIKK
ncbi:hypothetical protein T01_16176 [Trichinella spiralis]|uniref:PiggyBac transposable element-derived protein domain-containing protein n=1 Tax=Trichinella spiralis TaxID=6334 RepID=A0A0V1BX34_TRISP|nr:hypothetical protein T01_16176 [Trichinella spiralis]